jgi:hypothetical protein
MTAAVKTWTLSVRPPLASGERGLQRGRVRSKARATGAFCVTPVALEFGVIVRMCGTPTGGRRRRSGAWLRAARSRLPLVFIQPRRRRFRQSQLS